MKMLYYLQPRPRMLVNNMILCIYSNKIHLTDNCIIYFMALVFSIATGMAHTHSTAQTL